MQPYHVTAWGGTNTVPGARNVQPDSEVVIIVRNRLFRSDLYIYS